MPSKFTHFSLMAEDVEESVQFYEELLGLERIEGPTFQSDTAFLRCDDQQLHLFTTEDGYVDKMTHAHMAIHVDDFERVYVEAEKRDIFAGAGRDSAPARAFKLPDGSVQIYIRDPAGNLLEVDYPNADDIDTSVVNLIDRELQTDDQYEDVTESAVTGGARIGVYNPGFFD